MAGSGVCLQVAKASNSYLYGTLDIPYNPSVVGGLSASTMRNSNRCSKAVPNRNICILASVSPIHMRHPVKVQTIPMQLYLGKVAQYETVPLRQPVMKTFAVIVIYLTIICHTEDFGSNC